jgi:hypothetical protein
MISIQPAEGSSLGGDNSDMARTLVGDAHELPLHFFVEVQEQLFIGPELLQQSPSKSH